MNILGIKTRLSGVFAMSAMMTMASGASAQIVINEIMQSNIDCIMDEFNDFPDSWVELYNAGKQEVDLGSYSIADSEDGAKAWKLNGTIQAGGYALVYCDKEATGMHTGFRLETGKGCEVYLMNNGKVVDKVDGLKKQPAPNIAYGRKTDNSDKWGYMASPTPGAANCGETCKDILGEPVFDKKGRVITNSSSIVVSISLPEGTPSGTEIRVTYDGSEPTESSYLYTEPLNISATHIIRAKAFCKGYLSPRSTVESYIFFPRTMTLPVVSIVTDKKYLYDNKIGIYVKGTYDSGKANYEYEWRRPINIEMFEKAGVDGVINQLCETRIQGGATRSNKIKSLALYAHKRFGTKKFEYEFFPDQKPGLTNFKSIMLRNSGNDFDYLYQRDPIIQRTMAQNADLDWQAWKPVVVYINGEYIGIENIRERSNEDNIYSNYDGLEDIDMIENNSELKNGTWDNYNEFVAFYSEKGHTLEEYAKWIDWKEYINLMVMNLYFNNRDFPGNNIVMWRPRAEGGLWRFVAKDADFGLGLYGTPYDYKTINWLYDNNYDYGCAWANRSGDTRLFRRMMDDADFRREFLDHAAVYMGDFLNEKGVRAIWDPMYDMIKDEYPYHRSMINAWWPNYNDELNNARDWVKKRTDAFYRQLAEYYSMGDPNVLTVNRSVKEQVTTTMNGIQLTKGVFNGRYYKGSTMTLVGTTADGKGVGGWKIRRTNSDKTIEETTVAGSTYTFRMPSCASLEINAILEYVDAIDDVRIKNLKWNLDSEGITLEEVQAGERVELFNLQGMRIYAGVGDGGAVTIPLSARGVYILRVGNGTVKIRR